MDLSPKVRYTDTSYIIAQQWEKGREKNTFPSVYAYEYNRQKFANLAKCDEKQSIATANLPLSTKLPKRPLPVIPPMPPVQPNETNENDNDENKTENLEAKAESSPAAAAERRQRRRKAKSLERIRDQTNEIVLSDSDEEIVNKVSVPIPIITTTDCITIAAADEPDASVASITITDTIAVHTTTSGDEPAICIDAHVTCNDETVSDPSQISYDEILKIDESLNENAANIDLNESIAVKMHDESIIELRIHEEGDSDKEISASVEGGLAKKNDIIEIDRERCHSEDDTIGREENNFDKPERFVQSDSEVSEKTPIGLVLKCDINENVVILSDATKMNFEVIDLDYNHNDVMKSNEINRGANDEIRTLSLPTEGNGNVDDDGKDNEMRFIVENRETTPIEQPIESHHVSISSRSSFSESDGFESEPMYATVDAALQMKNYDAKSLITKSQTFPVKSLQHHEKTAADHLGLNYVTERILASVLPNRTASFQQHDEQTAQPALKHHDNEFSKNGRPHSSSNASLDDLPQDIYEQELISMLEQKHGKNYKLFDLESCISTITLEKLCELCKHMDAWLGSGRDKVVILQDRGDRQRLGSAIAAYLEYLNICASSYAHRNGLSNEDVRAQNAIARNWLDLDIFSMKKFLEDVIGPLRVPSHRRYLQYFSGLLSGKIRINSSPIYLRFVTIESPPSWIQNEPISLQQSEWRSFIKIYEGLNCVFTSDIHVIPITTRQFIYEIGQLRLRGDVIIRCYQLTMHERSLAQTSPTQMARELIFSTQFHTCAITNRDITFFRSDLDYACDDPRIPTDHKVTLHFSDNNQTNDNRGLYFQSPLVKLEPLNAVAKYNSLEAFDDDSLHTQGPLDGSLYATILKSPKSPLKSPTFPPAFISNIVNNNHHKQQQQSKTELALVSSTPNSERSSSNLISPPPEFSNKKIEIEIKECYTTISPIGVPTKAESNSSTLNRDSREQSKSTTRSHTSIPSYEEIHVPARSSSREATLRLQNQHYQTAARPGSSLSVSQPSELPQRSSSGSRSVTYATNLNQYLRPIDHFNYTNSTVQNVNVAHRSQSYQDGRESVNSPLTLSMDSGISSSGITNRRVQGSSVSPLSYPSQSPQERHQELDDILSDMLLTVQDIPDVGKQQAQNRLQQQQQQYVHKTTQNSTTISANHNRPQLHLQIPKQQSLCGSTNTVKRSQSCTSQDESNCSTISRSTVHTTGHIRDRSGCGDFYDTASTTATITPTPSDCGGRETPFQHQHQHQHIYGRTQAECKRDSQHQQILAQQTIDQRERQLIMDLQNQSFDYPQSLRTVSSASGATIHDKLANSNQQNFIASSVTSEDEESIPYHAREDSRPFTYGDPTGVQLSPNGSNCGKGTGMIKLQAGLSSPSLVRKHLGASQNAATNQNGTIAAHKSPNIGRNDFEEMLLQRREKILNEKYSIGDRTPNGNSVSNNNNKNNNNNDNHSASANVNNNKWNTNNGKNINGDNTLNGYQYHEPLKRSNTMDGGFGRGTGYTSDGSSGQTWLQLQQQKLRAKKELQHGKGDNDYYEQQTIHTEIHSRPQRSRSSQSSHHRYDGYSSDTGAFDSRAFIDEVDYRRPLHVQTPTRSNNDHSAGYHTITTKTTAAVSNERPFVSVKRAHEQSKANNNTNNIVGVREESFSSYRSETEADTSLAGSPRPETPAFPLTPRTPYGFNGSNQTLPPKSPTSIRKDFYSGSQHVINQNDSASCYASRRNSTTSTANSEPRDIAPHLVKFVRDSSKFWYKPSISREEAIALLRNAQPGSFIVRNSTTFNNAFGLVLKVSHPPPNAQKGSGGDELVRHFLIEPTARGVRLKGCSNEPVFTSLSALVYEHSINQLSLPNVLIIPDRDIQNVDYHSPAQQQLMTQGAACNVLYLFTFETESLTGPEAIRKAVSVLYSRKPLPKPTEVHFKVSQHGVTLTDNTRQLFFRKHYPANNISFIGLDPDDRRWSIRVTGEVPVSNKTIFAFVARRSASSNDNQCHVFCELEANQPAAAIAAFANKVIPSYGAQPYLRDI